MQNSGLIFPHSAERFQSPNRDPHHGRLPVRDHGRLPRMTNLALAGLYPPTGVCVCEEVEKATDIDNSFPLKKTKEE